jgi:hypothetical protein
LFWTGRVLIELDREFDPVEEGTGAVQMVLDDQDFAALKALAVPVERGEAREATWQDAIDWLRREYAHERADTIMHYYAYRYADDLERHKPAAVPVEREHEDTPTCLPMSVRELLAELFLHVQKHEVDEVERRVADALAGKLHWISDDQRALELARCVLAAAGGASGFQGVRHRFEADWVPVDRTHDDARAMEKTPGRQEDPWHAVGREIGEAHREREHEVSDAEVKAVAAILRNVWLKELDGLGVIADEAENIAIDCLRAARRAAVRGTSLDSWELPEGWEDHDLEELDLYARKLTIDVDEMIDAGSFTRDGLRRAISAVVAGRDTSPERVNVPGYRVRGEDGTLGNTVVDRRKGERRQGERRSEANSPRSEMLPQRRDWGKGDRRSGNDRRDTSPEQSGGPTDEELTELIELPRDLAAVLKDPGIIIAQDQKVFELIAKWQNAACPTLGVTPTSPEQPEESHATQPAGLRVGGRVWRGGHWRSASTEDGGGPAIVKTPDVEPDSHGEHAPASHDEVERLAKWLHGNCSDIEKTYTWARLPFFYRHRFRSQARAALAATQGGRD